MRGSLSEYFLPPTPKEELRRGWSWLHRAWKVGRSKGLKLQHRSIMRASPGWAEKEAGLRALRPDLGVERGLALKGLVREEGLPAEAVKGLALQFEKGLAAAVRGLVWDSGLALEGGNGLE